MARPVRLERTTPSSASWCSIQLSYGRPWVGGRSLPHSPANLAEIPVCSEPVSGSRSLICWENTGTLSGARLLGGAIRPNAASSRGHTGMFPKFGNREIHGNEHGFSRRESSSRTGGPGLFRGHSLQCCFTNTAGDGLGVPRMPFGFRALQLQRSISRMSLDAAGMSPLDDRRESLLEFLGSAAAV